MTEQTQETDNTQEEIGAQTSDTDSKYKYDLASVAVGATVGAAAGFVGAVGAVAGAAAASVGAGAVAGGAAGAGAVAGDRPRNLIAGGLSSLVVYSSILLGGKFGYHMGSDVDVRGFDIGTDKGVIVKIGDGAEIPYITINGVDFRRYSDHVRGEKDESEREYDERLNAILNTERARRSTIK